MAQSETVKQHPVVMFDGVCNFCNGTVQFIIDRDPQETFRFCALQSEQAAQLLSAIGQPVPKGDPDSILLYEQGKLYSHSTAALKIAQRMRGPWKLLAVWLIVPAFLRDIVYRFIARNRYKWFGKTDSCRVPDAAFRRRFLSAD
jgi:predicted DCC family thiol-disulfide oxidoreductase YuxK